jgi:hypothetical protein
VSFSRLIDALRCHRIKERVHIPAHWVTAKAHGKHVRVKLPAQTRTIKVTKCRPRVITRRVRVAGRWYTEHIVALPHRVKRSSTQAAFGAGTTVSGWLGTTNGNALGSQTVRIMTAPDNGKRHFRLAALATTGSNGGWSAHLKPGPSRLVEAFYGGTGAVEPSTSQLAHVEVPAQVALAIHPRHTHWGGTIKISGRLLGCCVPPAGELVVMRIGWHGGSTEIGHVYADRNGRFATTYTFLRGNGSETYRLWAATATESDYPYATGQSHVVQVVVG